MTWVNWKSHKLSSRTKSRRIFSHPLVTLSSSTLHLCIRKIIPKYIQSLYHRMHSEIVQSYVIQYSFVHFSLYKQTGYCAVCFSDVFHSNEKVLPILCEHSLSQWRPKSWVEPHYSVFLSRRLHTSGWSISRVINKITLVRFWQASVIAANELTTSEINQS